jgi:hypothetical protein
MAVIDMDEHCGWHDSVRWMDWDSRKIVGHLQTIPSVGDVVTCSMQSGNTYRGEITKVERPGDPPDMFFADVKDLE